MQFAIPVALCDPTELTAIAKTADEHGYGWIAVSDHLIYPREFSQPYPYTKDGKPRFSEDTNWPDPWVAISAMAISSSAVGIHQAVVSGASPFSTSRHSLRALT